MLASLGTKPFDSPDYRFEVKWDGLRCLAFLESSTRLQSRQLNDLTRRYPELADLHRAVRGQPAVLDGEIVLLSQGCPDFARLLIRHQLTGTERIRAAARDQPVTFVAFDLLYWKGQNIMGYPLHRRQALLAETVAETGQLVLSRPVEEQGIAFAQAVFARGLEGVVAKRAESPYLPGKRTRHWLKLKQPKTLFGVIIGYRERVDGGLGSVVVGLYDLDGKLQVAGQAGVSLPTTEAAELFVRLASLPGAAPPAAGLSAKLARRTHWVEPQLVCRLEYLEQTAPGQLRHAVFRELIARDPRSCTVEQLPAIPLGRGRLA